MTTSHKPSRDTTSPKASINTQAIAVQKDSSEEYRIKAALLLKAVRFGEPELALNAAERFRLLPFYSQQNATDIVVQKDQLKLKHALQVIALEQGYSSWLSYKQFLDSYDARNSQPSQDCLVNYYKGGGFLNEWHASYEAAKEAHKARGGYLLPYKRQYYICEQGYIANLGLDPQDPNWQNIGYDWVKPQDLHAWQTLNRQLKVLITEQG